MNIEEVNVGTRLDLSFSGNRGPECVTVIVREVHDRDGCLYFSDSHGQKLRCIGSGRSYVPHCIDKPAFESYDRCEFLVNGMTVRIENLPISEEEKTVVMLKYGGELVEENGFYGYLK